MLKQCVSLGGAGIAIPWDPSNPHLGEALADMWAGQTVDGVFTTSYFAKDQSSTPWVRLFAETDFIFNLPPTERLPGKGRQRYKTATPNPMQLDRLDQNIAQAKHAGLGVMLSLRGFPPWVNDLRTTNQFVLPPNNALLPWGGPPPEGRRDYKPSDFAWSLWTYLLMNRYHPHNRRSPAKGGNPVKMVPDWPNYHPPNPVPLVPQRASVDYFEIVNEPHGECKPHGWTPARPQGTVPNYQSAALMMLTGQWMNGRLNRAYPAPKGKPPLIVFAPASADLNGYDAFTTGLIGELKKVSYQVGRTKLKFVPTDRTFAWSHHNYKDVEQFAPNSGLSAELDAILAAVGVTGRYGPRTQTVRNLLRSGGARMGRTSGPSWWRGYRAERGTPDPALWLTEGGGRLEHLRGWLSDPQDPEYDSDTGQLAAKATQAEVIAKTVAALKRQGPGEPGEGVEMFTNFLFYDHSPDSRTGKNSGNLSGLCNGYHSDWTSGQQTKTDRAREKRPAFVPWTHF